MPGGQAVLTCVDQRAAVLLLAQWEAHNQVANLAQVPQEVLHGGKEVDPHALQLSPLC